MYRFLIGRRWLVRILAGVVLVVACIRLGMWQLDRADDREASNAIIEANLDAEPAPVDNVLSTEDTLSADDQWRSVVVRGEYEAERQLLMRLRPVDGRNGVHVVTPLITDNGNALFIDRGFVQSQGSDEPEVGAPATGTVEVTARVRTPEPDRGLGGDPGEGTIRYMDVDSLADYVGHDTYRAWGELITEEPASPDAPAIIAPPQVEVGPHLSYALQWFAFAVIGVVGFVLLIRTEGRADEKAAESEREMTVPEHWQTEHRETHDPDGEYEQRTDSPSPAALDADHPSTDPRSRP